MYILLRSELSALSLVCVAIVFIIRVHVQIGYFASLRCIGSHIAHAFSGRLARIVLCFQAAFRRFVRVLVVRHF